MQESIWSRAAESIRRWYWRRATLKALSGLDFAILRDVGLRPDELWRVADEVARGDHPRALARLAQKNGVSSASPRKWARTLSTTS